MDQIEISSFLLLLLIIFCGIPLSFIFCKNRDIEKNDDTRGEKYDILE